MRLTLPLLVLLACANAFAQPFVGPEVASDPIPPRHHAGAKLASPSVAMARDAAGVVIAWSMPGPTGYDRIHVTRLDSAGHAIGPVQLLPQASAGAVDALFPAITAAPGGGFLVAWLELPSLTFDPGIPAAGVTAYARLGADLVPSRLSSLGPTSATPPQVRAGAHSWIVAGNLLWEVKGDGSLTAPVDTGIVATGLATTDADAPELVATTRTPAGFSCAPQCAFAGGPFNGYCPDSCRTDLFQYTLTLVSVYRRTQTETFWFDNDTQPAVASDGNGLLLAWFREAPLGGREVVAARIHAPAFDDFRQAVASPSLLGTSDPSLGRTRPDAATDAQRYVVVWETTAARGDRDVEAAVIAPDGTVTPFHVAASGNDEGSPSVVATGTGAFLIAYETTQGSERRIAGRVVDVEPKRRATR